MKTIITILLLALLPVAIKAQVKSENLQHRVTLNEYAKKAVVLKDKEFKCVLIAVMYIKVYPNIQPVPQDLKIMPVEDSQLDPYHDASMQVVYLEPSLDQTFASLSFQTLTTQK